jgi:riboflavin synthase
MFTGIITHIANVKNLSTSRAKDLLISLEIKEQEINRDLKIGCSVACNGVCLTLVSYSKDSIVNKVILNFQASSHTLLKTNIKSWKIGNKINIEFALKVGDELGGHFVSGHIDEAVKVKNIEKINKDSTAFLIDLPKNLKSFIAPKGSIVINGVSLTINEVLKDCFSVNIISHTFKNTNFANLKVESQVNLEVDLIARYTQQLANKY